MKLNKCMREIRDIKHERRYTAVLLFENNNLKHKVWGHLSVIAGGKLFFFVIY